MPNQNLERELANIRYAIDQSTILATTDKRGTITFVNDLFCKISQYSREELIGQNHRIINSHHHPKAFFIDLWKTIASGKIWKGEIKNRAKDCSYYWVFTTIVPLLDEKGRPYEYVALRTDITEKKKIEHEKELLEHEVQHYQKLDLIGQLAGGVAHDFNNILSAIKPSAQSIQLRSDDPVVKSDSQTILDAAGHATQIVQQLLLFSRQLATDPIPTDINALIRHLYPLLKNILTKNSKLETQLSDGALMVSADTTQIQQVLLNLTINSRDAMPDGGIVRILTERVPGPYVRILVSDTGCGIPPDIIEKVFEPFFTTKPRGKGSGLGLSVVYGIIQKHKGVIKLESEVGRGTTVMIDLPELQ